MTLPKTLTINGKRWRVVLKPLRARGAAGQCDYRRREIQIDAETPEHEWQEIFLHELLHACLPERWPADVEEHLVWRLSPRLLAALKGIKWAP